MKTSSMLKKLIYLAIMSSFFYDSYIKISNLPQEADMFRAKYQHLQDFLKRNTNGYSLPYDTAAISEISSAIIFGFAVLQSACAIIVMLGKRTFAIVLILLTLLQTFMFNNPYYKNSTEIDR